jgi:hypothetical protein
VLYVLGNHEFYREKFPGLIDKLKMDAEQQYYASIGSNPVFHPMGERSQSKQWSIKLRKSAFYNL